MRQRLYLNTPFISERKSREQENENGSIEFGHRETAKSKPDSAIKQKKITYLFIFEMLLRHSGLVFNLDRK